MEDSFVRILGIAGGFGGLGLVLGALVFGEDALKRFFPRLRPWERDRVISLALLLGGLLAVAGLAGSVIAFPEEPCPLEALAADICF